MINATADAKSSICNVTKQKYKKFKYENRAFIILKILKYFFVKSCYYYNCHGICYLIAIANRKGMKWHITQKSMRKNTMIALEMI